MATLGGGSLTGVFEGMPIQAGDTDRGRAGERGGVANRVRGIASMTRAASATPTASDQLERNGNRKRLRNWRPEDSRAPSDWRSRMERTMRQLAQELTQLHRTIIHVTNLLEAKALCEGTQLLAMMTWTQEKE